MERPAVAEMIRSTLFSGTGSYDVIVGNHGTGRSAIVKKVAKETPGAVYAFIDPLSNNEIMMSTFIKALN